MAKIDIDYLKKVILSSGISLECAMFGAFSADFFAPGYPRVALICIRPSMIYANKWVTIYFNSNGSHATADRLTIDEGIDNVIARVERFNKYAFPEGGRWKK